MKIMIVDDHPVVRKGIKSILESEDDINVTAEAESYDEALEKLGVDLPDLAIVDIELKGSENGVALIKSIKDKYPQVKTLVMSMDDGSLYAERSIRAGALGYIAKEEASERIVSAIHQVMSGELYLSSKLSKMIASSHIMGANDKGPDVTTLSNKEFEIFKLIGQGYKRSEISKKMSMNINTIESHRRKIREKLDIKNSADLSRMAVKWYVDSQ
ncbi:MAG: response regulator transcription factor [Spirochaetes bacterium]|nr:response regulator transcription factor [Spirochaetota bacterium]MBN2770515.1 response regulator transcription factor [Spirochaetota bacterium]HRX16322.1 response regulator transcription factor [Spirochaetota bacterium]